MIKSSLAICGLMLSLVASYSYATGATPPTGKDKACLEKLGVALTSPKAENVPEQFGSFVVVHWQETKTCTAVRVTSLSTTLNGQAIAYSGRSNSVTDLPVEFKNNQMTIWYNMGSGSRRMTFTPVGDDKLDAETVWSGSPADVGKGTGRVFHPPQGGE